VGIFERDIAFRSLEDTRQVAGVAAIESAGGKGLRPHTVVGEAVDADKSGRWELVAEFSELREADEFKIHHGQRRLGAGNSASGLVSAAGSCDVKKLFVNGTNEMVARR
jgi:hypothetical protein